MKGSFFLSAETMNKFYDLKKYGDDMEMLVTNSFIIDNGCHPDFPIAVVPVLLFTGPHEKDQELKGMRWTQTTNRKVMIESFYKLFDRGQAITYRAVCCLN